MRAIFFDLDGVLVDTSYYHYLAWKKVFDELGGVVSEETVFLQEGRNSREILPILIEESGVSLPAEEFDDFIERKRVYYQQIVNIKFYDGVTDVLRRLKSENFRLGVVTASARKTMERSLSEDQRSMFDLIQTGDDVVKSKPSPEPYDLARKKLGLERKDCLVVENAPLGITSAKRAGMKCVAVQTTLRKEFLKDADYIISNIKELLKLPIINHKI